MMNNKRLESFNYPTHLIEQIQINRNSQNNNNILSSAYRQRVPETLQSALRGRLSYQRSDQSQEEPIKKSKLGISIKNKITQAVSFIKNVRACGICEKQIQKHRHKNLDVYMCNCQHKQEFCQSCLHHYTIYKVKSFEEVLCPHQGCPETLDINTNFFRTLPLDIQNNYKKIHQFYLTSKDPSLKLCPREDCEGLIKETYNNIMECNECRTQFCSKCLLTAHNGQCEDYEINFFEGNLHYRQCKKCKIIIEKNQGCNHMTCRCGYQFCYVCGAKWSVPHYGQHDQNGRLLPGEGGQIDEDEQCCQCCQCCQYCEYCQCCQCCECCECCECCYCECCQCDCRCQFIADTCGQPCVWILKFPLKLISFLFFFAFAIVIFLFRNIPMTLGILPLCIISGIFGFPCVIIGELQCPFKCLAIIFLPITMLAGIKMAFEQIFCQIFGDVWGQFFEMCVEGTTTIWSF